VFAHACALGAEGIVSKQRFRGVLLCWADDAESFAKRAAAPSCEALVEGAVDRVHNLSGGHVDQKQVGSIAHPLKARLRWR